MNEFGKLVVHDTWLTHVKLTFGCADLCGSEGAFTSGQKASGRGQKPTAKPIKNV